MGRKTTEKDKRIAERLETADWQEKPEKSTGKSTNQKK